MSEIEKTEIEEKTEEIAEAANEEAAAAEEKTEAAVEAAEEKTEEVAEKTEEKVEEKVEEKTEEKEEKPKKKGKAGKVILTIVGILVALLVILAACGFFAMSYATADTMPKAPVVSNTDLSGFAIDAATEVLSKGTITATPENIDVILAQVKETVNNSTDTIRIEDLFCEMEGDKGTLYARVHVDEIEVSGIKVKLNKTVPVQADFTVGFNAPEIVVNIGDVHCGKLKVPQSVIDTALANAKLPEEMRLENSIVYYDTTGLDKMVDEAITKAINDKIGNGTLAGLISNLVTEVVNVNLTDATIQDGNLVITGSVM